MLFVGIRHSDCSLKEMAGLAGTREAMFSVIVGYPSGESQPVPHRVPEILFWE